MTILIIDDSDYKVDQLTQLITEVLPDTSIVIARAFQTGMQQALNSSADLILLDISLPTFEVGPGEPGGRTRPFGGREILRELAYVDKTCKAIVVTQFDRFGEGRNCVLREDLMRELQTEFGSMVIGGVYYSGANSDWKQTLKKKLQEFRL